MLLQNRCNKIQNKSIINAFIFLQFLIYNIYQIKYLIDYKSNFCYNYFRGKNMRVCVLASSSKGNCTYVGSDTTNILIDAGVSVKDIECKLNLLKVDPNSITAILITHEHIDHIKSVHNFTKKYKSCFVYVHKNSYEALIHRLPNLDTKRIIVFYNVEFNIGDLTINSFLLPHDSKCCVGFTIKNFNNKISICTDLGHTTSDIIKNLYNSKLVILESNHDIDMLKQNPHYSYLLKNRILGPNGHLSNIAACNVVEELAKNNVKQVVLAHLSPENNTPELCYKTMCDYLLSKGILPNEHILIEVASESKIGTIFNLK